MVTSTSIPGSIDSWVIWRTVSVGDWRSITRLWILIWYLSQVLEPSPFGVLRVVILKVFVGILTGPLTLRFLSRAALTNSFEMRSMAEQFFEVIVIRILCSYYNESKIMLVRKCSRLFTRTMRVYGVPGDTAPRWPHLDCLCHRTSQTEFREISNVLFLRKNHKNDS